MIEELGQVTLKSGETVEASLIIGPEVAWAERLEQLLQHKGDPWNWQNSEVLRAELGIEAYFYVLHRAGEPLANIMTVELAQVGIFGHVWTNPEDRQKGASSRLMQRQMDHFRVRGGQALFLGTMFDSVAYHMYEKFGFHSIEPQSGSMAYYAHSQAEFEAAYFAQGETEIQALAWSHWPASPALFMGDFPGLVRCVPLRLLGRQTPEGALLSLLHQEKRRAQETPDEEAGVSQKRPSRAMVLQNKATTAVVGLAVWDWHPFWPDTCLVDVYCHPDYWAQAGPLLTSLDLPKANRYIAYSDVQSPEKDQVLLQAGFRQTATLAGRFPEAVAKTTLLDVILFEKSHQNPGGQRRK